MDHASQEDNYAQQTQAGGHVAFVTPTREQLLQSLSNIDVGAQVAVCENLGLRVVVVDFDKTLVRVHTKGIWTKTVEDLAECVRPVFKKLISSLLDRGIYVAVASFSTQEKLIEDVLCAVFPDVDIGRQIFVRCSKCPRKESTDDVPSTSPMASPATCSATVSPVTSAGARKEWDSPTNYGKQPHLKAIWHQCDAVSMHPISCFSQILLIDDDINNISIAKENGVRTIWFDADCGTATAVERLLNDMKMLE